MPDMTDAAGRPAEASDAGKLIAEARQVMADWFEELEGESDADQPEVMVLVHRLCNLLESSVGASSEALEERRPIATGALIKRLEMSIDILEEHGGINAACLLDDLRDAKAALENLAMYAYKNSRRIVVRSGK